MLEKIQAFAREAGALLLSARDIRSVTEEKTSCADLVTKYDRAVEALLRQKLLSLLPGAEFLGEEETAHQVNGGGDVFIVDPIDGTTNFVYGYRHSCISIGLLRRGEMALGVVYNPYADEMFCAEHGAGAFLNGSRLRVAPEPLERSLLLFGSALYDPDCRKATLGIFSALFGQVMDVRRQGSAALDLCYIAASRAGAFFECRLCPWDFAAGSLLVQEAGGLCTALDGSPLRRLEKCSVAAGNSENHRRLTALARQYL